MSLSVAEHYDHLSEFWHGWTPSSQFEHIVDFTVLGELRKRPGQALDVFDAGCGHGTWIPKVIETCARYGSSARILGVDISEKRIELGRQALSDVANLTMIAGDLVRTHIPSDFKKFDLIYSLEVFQHLNAAEQVQVLSRFSELLKPGGTLVIIDKDILSWHASRVLTSKAMKRWIEQLSFGLWKSGDQTAQFFKTVRYPSFARLQASAPDFGLKARPLIKIREFRALLLDKQANA